VTLFRPSAFFLTLLEILFSVNPSAECGEQNAILRARDEALLALLVYAGLRVQEVCDLQLRDLDLGSGTVTVRSGKAGKARRVPLHSDAERMLRRYVGLAQFR